MRSARIIALIAPLFAVLLYIPNAVIEEVAISTKAVYALVWIPAIFSVYFNLKHAIIPDLDFGFIKAIPICNTDDGGEIFISLLMYPEYFMGDPEHAESTPIVRAEIFYDDRQIDDADVIAEYGVKLIDCKYDKPIENTYK